MFISAVCPASITSQRALMPGPSQASGRATDSKTDPRFLWTSAFKITNSNSKSNTNTNSYIHIDSNTITATNISIRSTRILV